MNGMDVSHPGRARPPVDGGAVLYGVVRVCGLGELRGLNLPDSCHLSSQIFFELLRPVRMANLSKCLRLNLPDTFTAHAEILTDLFKGPTPAVF